MTEPPAEERPPRARPTVIEAKLGARATGSCQMLTRRRDNWRIGLRPNSSDQGAHSSQPKAYRTRKIIAPHRAPCSLTPNSLEMPPRALEYKLVLKFIETWTRKMTERTVHFLSSGQEYPSSSKQSSSVISILLSSSPKGTCFSLWIASGGVPVALAVSEEASSEVALASVAV